MNKEDEQKVNEVCDALDNLDSIATVTFTTESGLTWRHCGGWIDIPLDTGLISEGRYEITCPTCGKEFVVKPTCSREIDVYKKGY